MYALARRPCLDVRSIFLANQKAVKLADSPLGVGCGGIETAGNGTLEAVHRRASGTPVVRASPVRGCTSNVRGVRLTVRCHTQDRG